MSIAAAFTLSDFSHWRSVIRAFRHPDGEKAASRLRGYSVQVFLDAAGKDVDPFEPAERPIGILTTDAQGRFSLRPDVATLRASVGFRVELACDPQHRAVSATLR
jgi:hypothetical protein